MKLFSKLFEKPKKTYTKKIVTCSKHGVVPNYVISVFGSRNYDICWDCIGEFGSQYCTTQTIESEGE
jgi:hypothetical protein